MTTTHESTENTAKPNMKVALVFDDQTRPETTGVYCRRALASLAEVTFFHPSKLAEVPRGEFDLYLNIDDGMRYLWPAKLRPCAWWAIDTHIDFEWCLTKARGFDFVFAAQRDGASRLRQEGIESARWLPLACDGEIHGGAAYPHPSPLPEGEGELRPHPSPLPEGEGEKQFDVCFVGNLMRGPRADLVRLIQQHFKKVFVGQAYFEEMAKIYSASRIVFNRSVANDINMRVFEALASGSLLLTNDLADNGQAELFRDGVHLATYRDGHELLDKLRYYLAHDEVREKIAAAGREEVLKKHTYRLRMEEVMVRAQGTGHRERHARPAAASQAPGRMPSQKQAARRAVGLPFPRRGRSAGRGGPHQDVRRRARAASTLCGRLRRDDPPRRVY